MNINFPKKTEHKIENQKEKEKEGSKDK